MRQFLAILPLLALAAGCGEGPRAVPAPLDRFTFPTGLALAPLAGGGRALVVVSSNFDLRYAPDDGGSVLVVDPDGSVGDALAIHGAVRIASFGGQAAVVSGEAVAGATPSCPGWTGGAEVLVPSRSANVLYRIALDGAGVPSCGEGCRVPLDPRLADPFGVEVVCRGAPGPVDAAAYVTHLRTPGALGQLSRLSLAPGAAPVTLPALVGPTQSLAWDPGHDRLYVAGRYSVFGASELRFYDVFANVAQRAPISPAVRGAEVQAIAISSDGARAYVALRIYDADLATTFGRPGDVAGALAVVDVLAQDVNGSPVANLVGLVPVGVGPEEIEVMPRGAGLPDVVAISNTDEGTVTIYDDQSGTVAAVLGIGPGGKRLFGKRPGALVSEARGGGVRRLYVSSFDRGFVTAVDVDLAAPTLARIAKRFGREVP